MRKHTIKIFFIVGASRQKLDNPKIQTWYQTLKSVPFSIIKLNFFDLVKIQPNVVPLEVATCNYLTNQYEKQVGSSKLSNFEETLRLSNKLSNGGPSTILSQL